MSQQMLLFTSIDFNKYVFLIVCDFQKDMCGFIQDTSDNFNWIRNKGSTPTSGTGPILDHTLGSQLGIV